MFIYSLQPTSLPETLTIDRTHMSRLHTHQIHDHFAVQTICCISLGCKRPSIYYPQSIPHLPPYLYLAHSRSITHRRSLTRSCSLPQLLRISSPLPHARPYCPLSLTLSFSLTLVWLLCSCLFLFPFLWRSLLIPCPPCTSLSPAIPLPLHTHTRSRDRLSMCGPIALPCLIRTEHMLASLVS